MWAVPKKIVWITYAVLFLIRLEQGHSQSNYQTKQNLSFFEPSDTIHKKRLHTAIGGTATFYTLSSVLLYKAWYEQYPLSKFHLFNDWNEWSNMDKLGHIYSAYFQATFAYKGAKWTGLSDNYALLTAGIVGGLSQTTIEVMDGFSTEWGFSLPDFAANTVGIGAFIAQQKLWNEQRITFKVGSSFSSYDNLPIVSSNGLSTTTLSDRADELFGSTKQEKFLKDYNAQTLWASVNIASFLPDYNIPSWLNVAIGYGAQNMLGGFDNSWSDELGNSYSLSPAEYPRYHQFYISPDIDLTKIKVKSPFLKTLMTGFNIFKIPMPALEYNTLGEWRIHFVFM